MRLTADGLRRIIKEEMGRLIRESTLPPGLEEDISELGDEDYIVYQWVSSDAPAAGGLDLGDYAARLEEELNYVDDDADIDAIEADLAAIDAGTFSLETRQFDLDYEEPEMEDAGGPFYTVIGAGGGFIVEEGDPEGDDFEPYSHLARYDVASQSPVLGSKGRPATLEQVTAFLSSKAAGLGRGNFEEVSRN
jgi:hypothetical protein